MYGSFIKGEGDRFSDVEFYLFHKEGADINRREWVSSIHPVDMFFTNEYGTDVSIFENLVRGEFHFLPVSKIDIIKGWQGLTSFEHKDNMLLVDKEGRLADTLKDIPVTAPERNTPEHIEWLAQSLINNLLFTKNVLQRGEVAHAHQLFGQVQKYLLWLIRIRCNATSHWESPTKKLEADIPQQWYDFYMQSVPAPDETSMKKCLRTTFNIAEQLFQELKVSEDLRRLLIKIR
jgi:lincosamide nucleotidyltransferase